MNHRSPELPAVRRARELVARRAIAVVQLALVVQQSRSLIQMGRERRLASVYPLLRQIRGGSDAALLATVLSTTPLCSDCIAKKTGVPGDRLDTVVGGIGSTLKLERGPGQCRACLEKKTTTYRLATIDGAAAAATNGAARRPNGIALWGFLEEHPGQMFCTPCVALALGTTKRIDRLLMTAEGRGALRRHARCTVCGKDRLVIGLGLR